MLSQVLRTAGPSAWRCRCAPLVLSRSMAKAAHKRVDVILQSEVTLLGMPGDIVRVKPGFMRNFLYPQKMAVYATKASIVEANDALKEEDVVAREAEKEREALRQKVGKATVTFKRHSNDGATLHGSVTPANIAEALSKQHGIFLPETAIALPAGAAVQVVEGGEQAAADAAVADGEASSGAQLRALKALGTHMCVLSLRDPDENLQLKVLVSKR